MPNNTPYSVFCDFKNITDAHHRARSGRRGNTNIVIFEQNELYNLESLRSELQNKTYRQGNFNKFFVYDPKKRQIQSIPYRDRIVQHIMCDVVLTPYLCKRVIYDNCGCIIGRGQHFALKRLRKHIKDFIHTNGTNGYFLKCDIAKYFPSLSHEVIKNCISSQLADTDVRNLFNQIIDAYQTPRQFLIDNNISTDIKRGVPIGNQTSQIIGYYYLDRMDRYIKEKLRIKHYVRYMDDFIFLHEDKKYLEWVLTQIKKGLSHSLKLSLNNKTQITPLRHGIKFLGINFYIKDGQIITRVQKRTVDKFKSCVKYVNNHKDTVSENTEHFRSVFASYRGYFKHTNSRGKSRQIQNKLNVSIKVKPENLQDLINKITNQNIE